MFNKMSGLLEVISDTIEEPSLGYARAKAKVRDKKTAREIW